MQAGSAAPYLGSLAAPRALRSQRSAELGVSLQGTEQSSGLG